MNLSRIKKFQNFLKKKKIQYFIINRTDEFQGEYIASYAERLKWLTNFSGSAGFAVIVKNKNYLFVDGRYTVQAKYQSGKKFKIVTIPNDPQKCHNSKYDSHQITIYSTKFDFCKNIKIQKNLYKIDIKIFNS